MIEDLIQEYSEKAGWNEYTWMALMCQFISKEDKVSEFEEFLEKRFNEEANCD